MVFITQPVLQKKMLQGARYLVFLVGASKGYGRSLAVQLAEVLKVSVWEREGKSSENDAAVSASSAGAGKGSGQEEDQEKEMLSREDFSGCLRFVLIGRVRERAGHREKILKNPNPLGLPEFDLRGM